MDGELLHNVLLALVVKVLTDSCISMLVVPIRPPIIILMYLNRQNIFK